jgi:predicted RNA-binding Zn-ribbon protein involved in translation (DUF1610 family)
MTLSCSCSDDSDEDVAYWFTHPENYKELTTKRARRCKSCGEKITVGSIVVEFPRWRDPNSATEVKILGDDAEVSLASWYFCEACADLYFNLTELGFCVYPEDNMPELLAEYVEMVKYNVRQKRR